MDSERRRMGCLRVVEVFLQSGEATSQGSGYAIGGNLVLTAAHVLRKAILDRGPVSLSVRLLDATVHEAELVWWSRADAALLLVPAAPWRDEPDRDALRWGKALGDGVSCVARGFPRAQAADTETIKGTVNASTAVRSQRYDVNITEPKVVPLGDGESAWQGMSGAALFGLGRQLLGVILADPTMYGGTRLQAVPVARLFDDEDFRRHTGVHARDLEDVWNRDVAELHQKDFLSPPYEPLPASPADFHLLQAKHGKVPFIGRDDDLARLRAWCRSPDPFSVAVVNGEGGAGKTRLSAQLCHEFDKAGWSAGFAQVTELDRVIRTRIHVAVTWPTVLVLDYPDRASDAVIELIGKLARPRRGAKLRIMLVDRAPEGPLPEFLTWWHKLNRDTLGEIKRATKVEVSLAAGRLGPAERREHARRAWSAFGQGTEMSALDLSDDGYCNPLKVHFAVLQALRGETHANSDDAVEGFFIRETKRWEERLPAHHIADLTTRLAHQAVALATLTTPTPAEAVDLLTAFPQLADQTGTGIDRRTKVSEWLAELFPGGPKIAALAPDLLAEELLARTPDLLQLVLWVHSNDACTTAHTVTMLDALRLAGSRREAVREVLTAFIAQRLEALVHAATVDLSGQLAGAIDSAIVLCKDKDFDTTGQVATAATKISGQPPTTVDALARLHCQVAELAVSRHESPEAKAGSLTDLAAFRAARGDFAGASAAARQALDVYGQIGPPAALAQAAQNAGTCLAMSGKDNLTAGHELLADAAQRFQQLDPEHLPALVDTLTNLAACLADQGNQSAAADTCALALEHHTRFGRGDLLIKLVEPLRHLARSLPAGSAALAPDLSYYQPPSGTHPEWSQRDRLSTRLRLVARLVPGFAAHASRFITKSRLPLLPGRVAREQERRIASDHSEILRWLGFVLRDVGMYAEAIAPLAESVELLRQYDPDNHTWLAIRLQALGFSSAKAGQTHDAIAYAREAVAEYRAAADEDPVALTKAFESLTSYLNEARLLPDAADTLREVIRLYLQMVGSRPELLPDLASNYGMLGSVLSQLDQTREGIHYLNEGIRIYEELAKSDPGYGEQLHLFTSFATRLSNPVDYAAEARQDAERSSELAAADPDKLPQHIDALDALSSTLGAEGQFAEALVQAERALEAARQLPPGSVERAKALSRALSGVASWSHALGDVSRALDAASEAVDLLADLSGAEVPLLRAIALGTLSDCLIASNLPEEAFRKAGEAIEVLDELEKSDETAWLRGVALLGLGHSQLLLGRPADAIASLIASRAALGPSTTDLPLARGIMARNYQVEGECLARLGRPDEALVALGEVMTMLPADNDDLGVGLARANAFTTIANCHIQLGRVAEGYDNATAAISFFREHPPTDATGQVLFAAAQAAAGLCLSSMGQHSQAIPALDEAAQVYRGLLATLPTVAERLVQVLTHRAGCMIDLQEFAEAHRSSVEAIGIYAGRPVPNPVVQDPLALAQTFSALSLIGLDQPDQAIRHFTTAKALYDTLGPNRRAEAYVQFLRGLTQCLLMLGDPAGAARAAAEGMDTLRTLNTVHDIRLPTAQILALLAQARMQADDTDALEPASEAVRIFRELEQQPGMPPILASGLYILGLSLLDLGRDWDAVGALRESAARFQTLANPAFLLEHLDVERQLTSCLGKLGDFAGALQHARIALDLIAPVAQHDLAMFPLLPESILIYANSLTHVDRFAEAAGHMQEAATMQLALAQQNPAEHVPFLLQVFYLQADCLRRLGRRQEAEQVDAQATYWGGFQT